MIRNKIKTVWSKKWGKVLIIFGILVVIGSMGSIGSNKDNDKQEYVPSQEPIGQEVVVDTEEEVVEEVETPVVEEPTPPPVEEVKEDVPKEHKLALKKAEIYSDTMAMSKQGIYDQLVSEYGEKFDEASAQYAIDNLEANYNENALKKAKTYQETMAMSKQSIYDQLISEYGEKFTAEEAQYAIDNLE